MSDKRVLVIEDDAEIAELVAFHLRDAGYQVDHAADGTDGLRQALAAPYAVVVLDLMLPGMDGLEVCRALREQRKGLPVLMLTARSEETDKVVGLELGADDYLTKPFSVRELLARVRAITRRVAVTREEARRSENEAITCGELVVEPDKRRVTLAGQPVELTAKEFDLLTLFITHPGQAFTREQLLNRVWGYSFTGYEHTVNSHINRLRAKIEADPSNPRYVLTVWGFGYRFTEAEGTAAGPDPRKEGA